MDFRCTTVLKYIFWAKAHFPQVINYHGLKPVAIDNDKILRDFSPKHKAVVHLGFN
jgi:hypothetical protein